MIIKNGILVDPSQGLEEPGTLYLQNDRVSRIVPGEYTPAPEDEGEEILDASGKYVINVGTVGCPRSVPFASYVVVDAKEDGSVDVELRKLTFDYLGYRDSLLAANADVPIWLEDLVSRLGCSK